MGNVQSKLCINDTETSHCLNKNNDYNLLYGCIITIIDYIEGISSKDTS